MAMLFFWNHWLCSYLTRKITKPLLEQTLLVLMAMLFFGIISYVVI
jgi:hypothetical protein